MLRQMEVNRRQSGITSPTVLATLEQHLAFLDQQIADLKRQIQDHIDHHPHLRQQRDLLTSIPGIGRLTASKLLAKIRDIQVFDDARQLAAFARRLLGAGKSKQAVIAAVMRKLLHQVFGMLTAGQPFDPLYLDKAAALA